MGSYTVLILCAFLVDGVFGDAAEVKSVIEGDRVPLNTGVIKQQHDMVRWYFNDVRIALINGDASTSCLYDGKGRIFRDRLEVDYETGSLIITNITTEHAGRYEAVIIRIDSSGKSEKLNVKSGKCDSTKITNKSSNFDEIIKSIRLTVGASKVDKNEKEPQNEPQGQNIDASSGLSPAVVAVICVAVVGVLLGAAAVVVGVMICRHRSSRNDIKKNKQVLEQVSNDEKQNEKRHMI